MNNLKLIFKLKKLHSNIKKKFNKKTIKIFNQIKNCNSRIYHHYLNQTCKIIKIRNPSLPMKPQKESLKKERIIIKN